MFHISKSLQCWCILVRGSWCWGSSVGRDSSQQHILAHPCYRFWALKDFWTPVVEPGNNPIGDSSARCPVRNLALLIWRVCFFLLSLTSMGSINDNEFEKWLFYRVNKWCQRWMIVLQNLSLPSWTNNATSSPDIYWHQGPMDNPVYVLLTEEV